MIRKCWFWIVLTSLSASFFLPFTIATIGKAENAPWSIGSCSLTPTLYPHDNFRGFPLPLQVSVRNLGRQWGDSASSLCVPQGWKMIVYEHDSFRGRSLEVTGPDYWSDLKRNRPYGMNWGDKISSVAVFKWVDGQWQPTPVVR